MRVSTILLIKRYSRKWLSDLARSLIVLTIAMLSSLTHGAEKLTTLVLAGPFSAVSYPLVHMVETKALDDVAESITFQSIQNPDQLRLLAIGDDSADFLAMPANVAAILYNKGVPLKLLSIPVWGVLWIVSRDDNLKTLADFKGKEIAIPFRADMPDVLFHQLANAQGLDPKTDFKLRYTPHPLEAMQLLLLGQVDHALLAEPAVSMALRKSQSLSHDTATAALYRSVDLQHAWGQTFKRAARIPQIGLTARGDVLKKPDVVKRFQDAYAKSADWCLRHPQAAGEMAAAYLSRLTPGAIADSLQWANLDIKTATDAKAELAFFYQQLMTNNPALIGHRLPDAHFYYGD